MKRYLLLFIVFIYGTLLFAQGSGNHWNPNTGAYSTNMSVIAVVQLSGVEQSTVNIELGAFYVSTDELNGELRGSKRLAHIQTEDGSINRYMAHITVYGKHGDSITFRLYDHGSQKELNYVTEDNITYVGDATVGTNENPLVINFAKSITENSMMNEVTSSDDVIINGDITISENSNITAQSMKISDGKSLTIQNGGSLTVLKDVTNTDVDDLIIEEGGQIIQYNDNVAATFKNKIEIPTGTWGDEDKTGWQFISSPVKDVNISDFNPTTGDYDLYMYDGQEPQWVNFKKLSSTMYDFSSDPFNNGWTSITDQLVGWSYYGNEQNVFSYSNMPPLIFSANNYLITPQLSIISGTKLNFKAKRVVNNGNVEEKFKVLLSTSTNTNTNDFDVILRECSITNTDYEEFSIDLSNYAGQYIYIAFYHYGQGSGRLIIDDVEIGIEASFEKGIGYLASYQNENIAMFKGNLNYLARGGSYVIEDLNYSGNENVLANFHLLGNPFPFDINWSTDVTTSDVYNGFARIKPSDGAYEYFNSSGTIKSGEGFMVKTTGSNASISFSKGAASKSYRKEAKSVNIIASNSKGSDNLIVSLDDNEKAGFPKLDNFNENIANVYVRESEVNYGIFNYGNDINEIPFYFHAKEMGKYTLTFDIEGEFDNLYLLDKMTGEKVNIIMENEYSFMANSNDNPERFILTIAIGNDQDNDSEHFVYVNNGNLHINAEGTVQIIDMMGRIVMTEGNHNGIINISNLNSAAYIVRCVNENEVKTQKIVVL